jgi:hypothetical protein
MMGHKQLMANKCRYLSVAEGNEDFEYRKVGGREGGINQGKDKIPNKRRRWRIREKKESERERM